MMKNDKQEKAIAKSGERFQLTAGKGYQILDKYNNGKFDQYLISNDLGFQQWLPKGLFY